MINGLVLDVTWLAKQCEIDGEMLPPTRTLAHILNDMGYQQIEGRRLKIQKTGIITIFGTRTSQQFKRRCEKYHS